MPSSHDLASCSATELLRLYRTKQASPVEATKAVLARIHQLNSVLNAFCLIDEEAALAAARDSEVRWTNGSPRGLVDGVPASIKDLVVTRGWPTLRGSRTIDPKGPWHDDAPVVARLREQGAVLLGKTTTPEFGWKGVTDSGLTGITRNPWNINKTPGGSSGGAAAAVAAGMGPLAIGTDGGGSIRIPCSFTGLFGIKASYGRVPAWPLSPFGTIAHVGPITRTVNDAALMLTVLSQPDHRDWTALPYEARDYRVGLDDGVRGLRIAFSANLGYAKVDAEIANAVANAVPTFASLGAQIEAADPGFSNPRECFDRHWFAGAAYLASSLSIEQLALVDPGLREIIAAGQSISRHEFFAATIERGTLAFTMQQFHERFDLLVTPTLAVPAFDAGQEVPEPGPGNRWMDWTPFSFPFNLTQQPAATIPCGFTRDGLPIGLQIVGPRYADALVLRAARAFESVHPIKLPDTSRLAK
jgi:aspartyl-tRNA(Asn)/glutamyl-tRNA(Gln) amidotransferase subunit A